MHAKRSSSNNLHHRENADRNHQAETQKRSWQPKLTAQSLRSNCVHNLGDMYSFSEALENRRQPPPTNLQLGPRHPRAQRFCLTIGVHANLLCPILCPPPILTECYCLPAQRPEPQVAVALIAFHSNSSCSV